MFNKIKNLIKSIFSNEEEFMPIARSEPTVDILNNSPINKSSLLSDKEIINTITECIVGNNDFVNKITDHIKTSILMELETKYNIVVSEKLKTDISQKKQYIGQLDNYIKDRQNLNNKLEVELNGFLQNTQSQIDTAIKNFALVMQQQIEVTSKKHGVEKIKDFLQSDYT